MTHEEAYQAIFVGIEMVKNVKDKGYQVIGTGEMGIGNTTTSSAILTAFSGLPTDKTVGKGAGTSEETYALKKFVVSRAIEVNQPNLQDPVDVLAKLGGFDIAALTGVFLGAAIYRIPVVMDGFISAIAAMIAIKLNEKVKAYIVESHASAEQGFGELMKVMGMEPMFYMGMRLGEGSGCPLTFTVIDLACAMVNHMATFGEAQIDTKYLEQMNQFEF
jgi:nicotinate-nucleotide--dimethylbenzimidazole phosphoribosyltransferase